MRPSEQSAQLLATNTRPTAGAGRSHERNRSFQQARSAPGLRSTPYRPARAPHLVASPAACGSSIESLTKARRQRRVVSPLAASSALLGARGSRIQARRLARRSNARDLAQTGWSTVDRKAVHDFTLCDMRYEITKTVRGGVGGCFRGTFMLIVQLYVKLLKKPSTSSGAR